MTAIIIRLNPSPEGDRLDDILRLMQRKPDRALEAGEIGFEVHERLCDEVEREWEQLPEVMAYYHVCA